MISDFFFPGIGGVESHIYFVSYCLREMGHKVIIVSVARKEQEVVGVRYFANGIKVYYIPYMRMPIGIIMPSGTGSYTILIRNILYREKIDIMHGHQTASMLSITSMMVTKMLKIPYVFTQHSLYDFDKLGAIELSKVYQWMCRSILSKVICVSNTVRENFLLQTNMELFKTVVVPNAVDATFFCPRTPKFPKNKDKIRVVVLSRMTFRKGMDLLLEVLPVICNKYKNVEFLLCGDGPKKTLIEELIIQYGIKERVIFEGFVNFAEVPYILSSGDIFLNTSVSEAFCIAILEATACGLYVLSTNVGGISEILPNEMMTLCEANADDMLQKFDEVIKDRRFMVDKDELNKVVKEAYNWHRVTKETLEIYKETIAEYEYEPLWRYLWGYLRFDFDALFIFLLGVINYILLIVAGYIQPKNEIELAVDVPVNFK